MWEERWRHAISRPAKTSIMFNKSQLQTDWLITDPLYIGHRARCTMLPVQHLAPLKSWAINRNYNKTKWKIWEKKQPDSTSRNQHVTRQKQTLKQYDPLSFTAGGQLTLSDKCFQFTTPQALRYSHILTTFAVVAEIVSENWMRAWNVSGKKRSGKNITERQKKKHRKPCTN